MPTGSSSSPRKTKAKSFSGSLPPQLRRASGLSGLHRRLERRLLRCRIQPDKGVRDHRSARVSAGSESAIQILGRPRQIRATDKSEFANQTFNVEIHNPKGEKIFAKAFTADAYGGIEGEFDLPADATLGVYQLFVVNYGGGSFRVEEYKKPEFEVTVDAPNEPVMLGEKIKATIRAKYYFGSPVTMPK